MMTRLAKCILLALILAIPLAGHAETPPKPTAPGMVAVAKAKPLNSDQPPPPFLQQHPFIAGFLQGVNGNWIAAKFFNRTLPALPDRVDAAAGAWIGSSCITLLPILVFTMALNRASQRRRLALARAAKAKPPLQQPPPDQPTQKARRSWFSFKKAATKKPDVGPELLVPITDEDRKSFEKKLQQIQAAWSDGDLMLLKQHVGPEYIPAITEELDANTKRRIRNRIEDLSCKTVTPVQSWQEGLSDFARIRLTWTARDFFVWCHRTPDDPFYLAEGDPEAMIETTQEWVFRRPRHGEWILSDIDANPAPCAVP